MKLLNCKVMIERFAIFLALVANVFGLRFAVAQNPIVNVKLFEPHVDSPVNSLSFSDAVVSPYNDLIYVVGGASNQAYYDDDEIFIVLDSNANIIKSLQLNSNIGYYHVGAIDSTGSLFIGGQMDFGSVSTQPISFIMRADTAGNIVFFRGIYYNDNSLAGYNPCGKVSMIRVLETGTASLPRYFVAGEVCLSYNSSIAVGPYLFIAEFDPTDGRLLRIYSNDGVPTANAGWEHVDFHLLPTARFILFSHMYDGFIHKIVVHKMTDTLTPLTFPVWIIPDSTEIKNTVFNTSPNFSYATYRALNTGGDFLLVSSVAVDGFTFGYSTTSTGGIWLYRISPDLSNEVYSKLILVREDTATQYGSVLMKDAMMLDTTALILFFADRYRYEGTVYNGVGLMEVSPTTGDVINVRMLNDTYLGRDGFTKQMKLLKMKDKILIVKGNGEGFATIILDSLFADIGADCADDIPFTTDQFTLFTSMSNLTYSVLDSPIITVLGAPLLYEVDYIIDTFITTPQIVLDSLADIRDCVDGAIFISVLGGFGPYDYLWSNGSTFEDLDGSWSPNAPGYYTVTVTDQAGCMIVDTFRVNNDSLIVQINTSNAPTLKAEVSGGTPPYLYEWSTGSFEDTTIITSSGTYWVKVTDKNWCSKYDTVYVNPSSFPVPITEYCEVFQNNNDLLISCEASVIQVRVLSMDGKEIASYSNKQDHFKISIPFAATTSSLNRILVVQIYTEKGMHIFKILTL